MLNHVDSEGNYLKSFGKEGSAPGDLTHPRGITTDAEGFILVADSGYQLRDSFLCAVLFFQLVSLMLIYLKIIYKKLARPGLPA